MTGDQGSAIESSSVLILLDQREQFLGSRHPIAVAQQAEQLVPITMSVEPDTNPSTRTDIGRRKESIGCVFDHQSLVDWLCLAPDRWTAGAVMIVGARIHGEDLVFHPKGGFAPRFDFVSLGKRQREFSHAGQGTARHD